MDKIELLRKERKESYLIFWLRFTNLRNLFPIVFSIICIILTYYFLIILSDQNNTVFGQSFKIVSLLFSLLSGLSVKWFSDILVKIRDGNKIKERAIISVRQLDSLHLSIITSQNYSTSEMKNIEDGIILAIESWNDILPELQYRDRTKIKQAIERQMTDLKNKADTITKEEYESIIQSLIPEIEKTEYLGLNYTGGTKTVNVLQFEDFKKTIKN